MNATDTVRNTLDLCTPPMSGTQSAKAYAALADLEALVQAAERACNRIEALELVGLGDLTAAVARVEGDTT